MSNADKKRAESLANLFAAPAPVPTLTPVPGERDAASPEESTAVAAAVGVMGKVIALNPIDTATPVSAAVESAEDTPAASVPSGAPVAVMHPVNAAPAMNVDETLVPAQVIEHLTTPARLSGVTRRHNVQVPAETLTLLRDVDKKLATTGRPVVSRNALLAMAAARVIANPSRYENQTVSTNMAGAGIQARLAEDTFVQLRAAAYSTEVPLVTTHAMAVAVQELLTAAKKGLRK